MILLLLTLFAVQEPAQPLSVRGEVAGPDFHIILTWTAPVEFTTASNTRELTIRFDKTAGTPVLDAVSREFPQWVEGISSGYDSLLIRSTQEVNYTVEKRANDVLVRLTLRGAAPVSEATDRKADFRLEILRAQLLSRGGQDREALELLDRLEAEYPAETLVLLNRGEIQLRRNRWREATAAYKQALAVDPGNDDARDALNTPVLANQREDRRNKRGSGSRMSPGGAISMSHIACYDRDFRGIPTGICYFFSLDGVLYSCRRDVDKLEAAVRQNVQKLNGMVHYADTAEPERCGRIVRRRPDDTNH